MQKESQIRLVFTVETTNGSCHEHVFFIGMGEKAKSEAFEKIDALALWLSKEAVAMPLPSPTAYYRVDEIVRVGIEVMGSEALEEAIKEASRKKIGLVQDRKT